MAASAVREGKNLRKSKLAQWPNEQNKALDVRCALCALRDFSKHLVEFTVKRCQRQPKHNDTENVKTQSNIKEVSGFNQQWTELSSDWSCFQGFVFWASSRCRGSGCQKRVLNGRPKIAELK